MDINLGTGRGNSVREIVEAVQNITQKTITVHEKTRRPGDAPILIANAQKCLERLNFTPQMSDLDTIIKTAWDFYRQRFVALYSR